jgi:hypothetical protein
MKREPMTDRIANLLELDRNELLREWEGAYGQPAPSYLSTQLLQRAIAHQLQAAASGNVPRRVRDALRHAGGSPGAPLARKLKSGTKLLREWNGVAHVVEVVDGGFRYRNRHFSSLTSIAFEITGARWSGPKFFGLKGKPSQ